MTTDGDIMQGERVVLIDRDDQEHAPETSVPTPGPTVSLLSTGVDILSGPAEGKRIYFTHKEAALGARGEIAVIISYDGDTYSAQKTDQNFIVTINDDPIDQEPVKIDQDDLISFANLTVRFFVKPGSA